MVMMLNCWKLELLIYDYCTFEELQENGDLFKAVNEATKGQHGVYTITSLTNGENIKFIIQVK